jgi:hypothetical protein
LAEGVEFVESPFGGCVQVGLDDGEVGEALQGAPAAAGGALLDLDGPARALRFIVRERHREIRGKPQDHVFEPSEPRDEGAGLVGELGVFALVVGVASGECSQVVVADLLQRGFVEAVGATITGLVGGAVGFQQGVGHRLRP